MIFIKLLTIAHAEAYATQNRKRVTLSNDACLVYFIVAGHFIQLLGSRVLLFGADFFGATEILILRTLQGLRMFKKSIFGLLLSAPFSLPAFSQDYLFEIGTTQFSGDDSGRDYDGTILEGTLHFSRVDTSLGAFSEASFLDKSSHIRVARVSSEYDDVFAAEEENDEYVFGRFVIAEKVIVEAAYATIDFGMREDTLSNAGVGFYAGDNTEVILSYSTYDEMDYSEYRLSSHGAYPLAGDMSIGFDAVIAALDSRGENGTTIDAGLTFYPNRKLGFGISAGSTSFNDYTGSTASFSIEYFVVSNVELTAAYSVDSQDDDGDSLFVGVSFRI